MMHVHIATFIPLFCCLIKIQLVLQRNMILLDQRRNKRWERSNEMCPLDFLCGAYLSIHNQLWKDIFMSWNAKGNIYQMHKLFHPLSMPCLIFHRNFSLKSHYYDLLHEHVIDYWLLSGENFTSYAVDNDHIVTLTFSLKEMLHIIFNMNRDFWWFVAIRKLW